MARRRNRKVGRPPQSTTEQTVVSGGGDMIGYYLPGTKGQDIEYVSPDDLLGRRGFRIYREMRNDDQVKAALWFKKILIAARAWDITPASDSEEDKNVAQFITDAFNDVAIKDIIWDMLSAFDYGFCCGEIKWEIEDKGDGLKMYLDKVTFRDPEHIKIVCDKHGNIVNFVQRPTTFNLKEIYIKPEKVIHWAYNGEFSNHYGVSDLRGVYRAWWSKKYVTQFWNVFLERFGSPLMMMKYPQGASQQLKNDLKSVMMNLSAKSEILVPEGVAVELIEATRAGQAQYGEALTHFDVRIATGLLVPALLGMGVDTKRGSDSQSRLHLRTLMKMMQLIGEQVSRVLDEKIIQPLVEANFNVKKMPKFTFQDYGEFESFQITDAIKELFNAGILDMDQEDVNFARSILGLPIRPEDHEDEVLRSQPPPIGTSPNDPNNPNPSDPQAQKGGGAQQGNNRAKKGPSTKTQQK